MRGVGLDLLAQEPDIAPDRAGIFLLIFAPGFLSQRGLRYGLPFFLRQADEQPELSRRQCNGFAISLDRAPAGIDHHFAQRVDAAARPARGPAAREYGLD